MKKILKDYFTFTKKERIGVAVLLCLIACIIVLPHFFSLKSNHAKPNTDLLSAMQQLQQKDSSRSNDNTAVADENIQYEMFVFDPNAATASDWKKLGLKDKTIRTILNYTGKGGKFYKPDDLRKIWGLRKDEADRLIPYIQIQNSFSSATNKPGNTFNQYPKKEKTISSVDINSATPQDLMQLPISDRLLCYKIINYRDKLGGFINVNQVKETYGMSDSVFNSIQQYLIIQNTNINKININTAPDFVLTAHPYIGRNAGKAIVIYREQHGNYSKIEDVKKIVFITDAAFQKMAPYITVE